MIKKDNIRRIFYDFEFVENGETVIPVSIGMVDEQDKALYIINKPLMLAEYYGEPYYWKGKYECNASKFVQDEVYKHISRKDVEEFGAQPEEWADIIHGFISNGGEIKSRDQVELWGYFSSYDHLCLAQCFGTMMQLPEPIPMNTHDVLTINNGKIIDFTPMIKHHPVYDAFWTKKVYDVFSV